MQITLRKASTIANDLLKKAASPEIELTVDAYMYPETYQEKLVEISNNFDEAYSLHKEYIVLAYHLRGLIGEKNHEVGINDIMRWKNKENALLKQLHSLQQKVNKELDEEYIKRKISLLEKRDEESFYGNSVDVSPFGLKKLLEEKEADIKASIRRWEERLTELNYSSRIELDQSSLDKLLEWNMLPEYNEIDF